MRGERDVGPATRARGGRAGCLAQCARVLCVALVLGLTFYVFGLRPWVERRLQDGLGASAWSLSLRSVAWNRLALDDLRLADGERLRVASLSADYDPLELWRGHVRRLRVVGATWEIRWVDGKPDLGLPALAARDAAPRVERIELSSSTIVLRRGEDVLRVGVEGWLDWSASDALQLELLLRFPGLPLVVRGSLPAPGRRGAMLLALHPVPGESRVDLRGTLPGGALVELEGRHAGDGTSSWELELGATLVEGGPLLAGHGVRGRVGGSLAWRAEVAPDRLQVELAHGSSVEIEPELGGTPAPGSAGADGAEPPAEAAAWRTDPLAWSLSGGATLARDSGQVSGSITASLSRPVELAGDGLAATLERATLELARGDAPERSAPASLHADLEIGRLTHESGIELSRIVLAGPIHAGPIPAHGLSRPCSVAIERATWRGTSLPGPSGTLRASGASLELDGRWQPTSGAALDVRARVDPRAGSGELRVTAAGAAIRRGDALEQWLFGAAGLHAEADVDLELTLARDEGGARSALSVSARHGSLVDAQEKRRLDGIALAVALVDLATPRSRGPATLSWESGRAGELALGPGAVRFALESRNAVLVEAVELTTQGSRFWTHGFRLDPSAPAAHVRIACQEVDLGEWLDLMAAGRVTGEGRLNGWLALELDLRASPPFELAGGFLDSTGGRLRFDDEEAVRTLLEQNLGSYTIEDIDLSEIMRERLVGALSDFDYSSLTCEVIATDGDATLRATLDGQGAVVPQEVGMTVNINGFGSLLTFLLELDTGG